MRATEAARHLPVSKNFIIKIFGDRDFDMVEIVAIRSRMAFSKLELTNKFRNLQNSGMNLSEEIIKELDRL